MGDSDGETLSNVTQGDFDFDDEAFDEISHDAKDFIEKCLNKNMRYFRANVVIWTVKTKILKNVTNF